MTSDDAGGLGPAGQTALVRAIRRVLRPIVGLLVARQIAYPFLANLLREVYVEVAETEFALAGKRLTDSRISLLTGVYRRDVKRVRAELREGHPIPPAVSLGAEIVARWNGTPLFLDDQGRARPLPVQSKDEPSFETLVTSVSRDIRARSVLDEWLRLGVVHFDDRGRVALDAGVFVPKKGEDEKIYYLGRNLHDHAAAAAHNVQGGEPPFVDRTVYYGSLSPDSIRELSELAATSGMGALQALNRRAIELKDRDRGREDAERRMTFGVYFYEADNDDSPQTEGGDA